MPYEFNAFENVLIELETILKSNDIAEAFHFDFDNWQYHVFYGIDDRFTLKKNRGRLPFIEYEMDQETYQQTNINGGVNSIQFKIKFSLGGSYFYTDKLSVQIAMKKAQAIILTKIKETWMIAASEDSITVSELQSLPWGFQQELTFVVDLSYDRTNYGDTDV